MPDGPGRVAEQGISEVDIRVAESAADRAAVMLLRDIVYVRDQGRLTGSRDMATTFDKFDSRADYLLAHAGGEPIGAVKIIADSAAGLPCEDVVDIAPLRQLDGARLVEFGHLLTVPRARNQSVGMRLMRAALLHALGTRCATHIIGDFFIDDGDRDGGDGEGLRSFYRLIGFTPVGAPYRDTRFKDSPLSLVAVLDLPDADRRRATSSGKERDLLDYFFHDYPERLARGRARLARRAAGC